MTREGKERWGQIDATNISVGNMEALIRGSHKMLTSSSRISSVRNYRRVSAFCSTCRASEARVFQLARGKKEEEQKEEWQLRLDSGTDLHEPACSRARQQAIKNRSRYFLAIKVGCD